MTDAKAKQNGRKFLGPQDVKRQQQERGDMYYEFTLPGYEGEFRVKKVGWREKEEVDLAALVPGPADPKTGLPTYVRNGRMYMPRIVAIAWVDENGDRFLPGLAQAEELADADIEFISLMYEKIAKFNKFSDEDREAVGKDLKETPTPSGGQLSVLKS